MEEITKKTVYEKFAKYNAKEQGDVKKKGNYDYLPWADAWEEVLKVDPLATYDVERDPTTNRLYSEIGNTAVVSVCVTIDGLTRKEYYPVESTPMHAIPMEKMDASSWNKAVKRGLVKCLAQFGLGLQLYRGEELTEAQKDEITEGIKSMLANATKKDELMAIYSQHREVVDATPLLKKMFGARKNELGL